MAVYPAGVRPDGRLGCTFAVQGGVMTGVDVNCPVGDGPFSELSSLVSSSLPEKKIELLALGCRLFFRSGFELAEAVEWIAVLMKPLTHTVHLGAVQPQSQVWLLQGQPWGECTESLPSSFRRIFVSARLSDADSL